jgi:hypothetical protein
MINKLNILNCVGQIHLFGMIFENIYGFIIPKHELLDKLYVIIFTTIPCSWILCKDECIISYFVKKCENPNYIMGNEPENSKDITDLFYNIELYRVFYHTNHVLRIGSLYIVNNRTTNIYNFIFIPTIALYTCYIYDIMYKINHRKSFYPYFQILFGFYLFSILYLTIHKIKNPV